MSAKAVSVVIPAFRAAGTLKRTIDSCLADVAPHDIVVVLDGADAALEQVARSSVDGVRVVVLPAQSGAPTCRNVGLCLVATRYVMFLDADDHVEGGLLSAAVGAGERSRADLMLGSFSFEMPDGARQMMDVMRRYDDASREGIMRKWLSGDYTPPCAVVWRSDFVRSLGGWDQALAKNQDGDLIYRALMADARIALCRGGQGLYAQSDNPARITLTNTRRTLGSQLAVLDKIRARLDDLPFDPSYELGLAYYSVARLAFSGGFDDIGRAAETTARTLGLEGQPGSAPHHVLASMFGLRGKQRLASFVRRAIGGHA